MTNNPLQTLQKEASKNFQSMRHALAHVSPRHREELEQEFLDQLVAHVFTAAIENVREIIKRDHVWEEHGESHVSLEDLEQVLDALLDK